MHSFLSLSLKNLITLYSMRKRLLYIPIYYKGNLSSPLFHIPYFHRQLFNITYQKASNLLYNTCHLIHRIHHLSSCIHHFIYIIVTIGCFKLRNKTRKLTWLLLLLFYSASNAAVLVDKTSLVD